MNAFKEYVATPGITRETPLLTLAHLLLSFYFLFFLNFLFNETSRLHFCPSDLYSFYIYFTETVRARRGADQCVVVNIEEALEEDFLQPLLYILYVLLHYTYVAGIHGSRVRLLNPKSACDFEIYAHQRN